MATLKDELKTPKFEYADYTESDTVAQAKDMLNIHRIHCTSVGINTYKELFCRFEVVYFLHISTSVLCVV